MEWYDFYLYGFASAVIFNQLFFPQFAPLAGTLAAFGAYALGFFARPFGGVFFGHFGDKIGRRTVLVITLLMMGIATTLVGLLPTYATIGIWAPILLTVLRLVQGFGAGAEWSGAIVMVGEYAPPRKRAFLSSIPNAGIFVAIVLSLGAIQLFSLLPEDQFLTWGWRIPFLLSFILVIIGLYIRLRVAESPVFTELRETASVSSRPVVEMLRTYPKNLLLGMGTRFAETGGGYLIITFVLTYLTTNLGLETSVGLLGVLIASVLTIFTIPAFGALSDRVGRRPVYMGGAVFLALFAFPYFWLLDTQNTVLIWLAIVISIAIAYGAMGGSQPALYLELFDARVRYSGVAATRELSAPVAGGIAPFVATALIIWSGGEAWPVALYMIALCLITIVSLYLLTETAFSEEGADEPLSSHRDVREQPRSG
jgi:metabolite-proton symporter